MNKLIRAAVAKIHIELAKRDKSVNWLSEQSGVSARKLKRYLVGDSDIEFRDIASIAWALDMDLNVSIESLEQQNKSRTVWANPKISSERRADNFHLAA